MYRYVILRPIISMNWPNNDDTNKIKLIYMQTSQISIENINE